MSTFERHVLPNGLRVLTAPMEQAQSVSCFVMLAAGALRDARVERHRAFRGAHVLQGTERRPTARDISTEIDSIGGEFNAFTGKEITGYYVRCAGESRDIALDVLVDMLRHSRFDPEEIDREKGVIVEEMNMYFDTPRDYVSGVFDDLMYGDHPLGWDILGRKETVRGAARETFISYLDRWYTAPRMVVGVAGARRPGLDEKLMELLGDLPEGGGDSPEPAAESPNETRVKLHEAVGPGAHLHRLSNVRDRASRPLRRRAPAGRARGRHVVAKLFTEVPPSGAGWRTTCSPSSRATRTPARCSRRPGWTSSGSTRRSRRSSPS